MSLFRSLSGMVETELTSADIPGSLMAITGKGIELVCVSQKSDISAIIQVDRKNYRKLKALCQKRGDTLRLVKRSGIYWKLKTAFKRPVLVGGITFFFVCSMILPTRVLFVRVEGNDVIPSRQIQEAAAHCGIDFWASRREIRSERVKNALLQMLPQLQWVGINTYGCVAVISVTERSMPIQNEDSIPFGHMVAIREGIVLHCTATRGTLLCQPGQAVVRDQVLISGYTDCGIKLQATGAEGEIFGRTIRKIDAILPGIYELKTDTEKEKKVYSLLLGKKRINLWKDSGISDGSCGRIYEENYITLPGGFSLPVGWSVDTWIFGSRKDGAYPENLGKALLRSQGDAYIRQQMIAGTVESSVVTVTAESGYYRQEGKYVCTEMIGKLQTEKIGETNGKSD